jgi:mono/diheme cytochrome c family protein
MNNLFKIGTAASLLVFSSALILSCTPEPGDPGTQYAAQMYEDAAYESLKQVDKNTVNPGGQNLRVPAANTIARGKLAYYNHIPKENAEEAGVKLKNPLVANEANIQEGEVLYARFCTPCHGAEGNGDGLVGQKFKGVANLTQGRYLTLPQGHIYHVITHGRGRMMPHGTQVNPEERWKIAMYVKNVLQGQEETQAPDVLNIDAPKGASEDVNTNTVTGTTNPSGGATENSQATKPITE